MSSAGTHIDSRVVSKQRSAMKNVPTIYLHKNARNVATRDVQERFSHA